MSGSEVMQEGILFYNTGTKCLPRLLVAIHSLRKQYIGNVCILSSGNDGVDICKDISIEYNCIFLEMNSDIEDMKHHYWFEKSRMHKYTPFYKTIFMDSDTVTIKDPSDLFKVIEDYKFVVPQFANWTTQNGIIQNRLKMWESIDKKLVEETLSKKAPSVNVGVYGFTKDSEFMNNWFDFTIQNPNAVLPEESSCHLLLNRYQGIVVDGKYNCSCKFDNPMRDDVRIIHYHGRKHCREKEGVYQFHGTNWVEQWMGVLHENVCDVNSWFGKCGDRYLRKVKND